MSDGSTATSLAGTDVHANRSVADPLADKILVPAPVITLRRSGDPRVGGDLIVAREAAIVLLGSPSGSAADRCRGHLGEGEDGRPGGRDRALHPAALSARRHQARVPSSWPSSSRSHPALDTSPSRARGCARRRPHGPRTGVRPSRRCRHGAVARQIATRTRSGCRGASRTSASMSCTQAVGDNLDRIAASFTVALGRADCCS